MKQILSRNYTKRIRKWILQGKFYFLSVVVVVFTILQIIGEINFYPEIISVALIVTGLFILLILLFNDAKEFSDNKANTPRNWIRSFPTIKPVTVSVSGVLTPIGTLEARVITSIPEDATLENKVEFLLRQVRSIQDTIASINSHIGNVETSLKHEIKGLSTNLINIDASLKLKIADHVVGAYDLNFFGTIITLCGTIIQFFSTR